MPPVVLVCLLLLVPAAAWGVRSIQLHRHLAAADAEDPARRSEAALGLATHDGPEADRALRDLIADPEASVRATAARAMGRRAEPDFLPDLVNALAEEADEQAALDMVRAIARINGRQAGDALTAAMAENDGPGVALLAYALVETYGDAAPEVDLSALTVDAGDPARAGEIERLREWWGRARTSVGAEDGP